MSTANIISTVDGFARKVVHNGAQNVFQLEKDGQIVGESYSSFAITMLSESLVAGEISIKDIPAYFKSDLSRSQEIVGNTVLQFKPELSPNPGRATRIDIEEELKAIERGECPLCRISARHPDDTSCQKGLEINNMWDNRGTGCDCCSEYTVPGWIVNAHQTVRCPQCNPVHDGFYVPVENEPVIRDKTRGRWEYVRHTKTNDRRYLHMDCDALTNDQGYCLMCGSPCPTLWNEGGLS